MSEPFDIASPSQDRGHEAIRLAVVKAIEDLSYNTDDVGISLSLVDLLFQYIDDLVAAHDAQRIRIDAVNVRCDTAIDGMDALQERVAAIEQAAAVLSGPDAAG